MPITQDNRYRILVQQLDIVNGKSVAVSVKICRACGVLVGDTKAHTQWHKENNK